LAVLRLQADEAVDAHNSPYYNIIYYTTGNKKSPQKMTGNGKKHQ